MVFDGPDFAIYAVKGNDYVVLTRSMTLVCAVSTLFQLHNQFDILAGQKRSLTARAALHLHLNNCCLIFAFSPAFYCRWCVCLQWLSSYLAAAGHRTMCSTSTPTTIHKYLHRAICHICFLVSTGWQWQTVWSIQLFIIGWIDDFGIIFKKSCAFAVCDWCESGRAPRARQFICIRIHRWNDARGHVSTLSLSRPQIYREFVYFLLFINQSICDYQIWDFDD